MRDLKYFVDFIVILLGFVIIAWSAIKFTYDLLGFFLYIVGALMIIIRLHSIAERSNNKTMKKIAVFFEELFSWL